MAGMLFAIQVLATVECASTVVAGKPQAVLTVWRQKRVGVSLRPHCRLNPAGLGAP